MAIVEGTVFSRTTNTDKMLRDSAMSTNCALTSTARKAFWGSDTLHYYQYMNPQAAPDGVFASTENVKCSNGQVMKTDNWKIRPTETFMRERVLEIEDIIKERGIHPVDSVETTTPVYVDVTPDNPFYGQVSNNMYVEFSQNYNTMNHNITFNIPRVLSNVPYDIYIVAVPALAGDTTAVGVSRTPVKMRFRLNYHDADGNEVAGKMTSNFTTEVDSVQWIKIADKFSFPVCTYGVDESDTQATLYVETRVGSGEASNGTAQRTMRFDCIVLKPHEE